MQRSAALRLRSLRSLRGDLSSSSATSDKIVATVLFERLPVVIPKIDPVVYTFQEFPLRWQQHYRRRYPDEVLSMGEARGKGDYQIEYGPAPRITEADKKNDKKSLQSALDRRLYLLLYDISYASPDKKLVWHFPEKVYENEGTLRLQFFFKSQVIGTSKLNIGKCEDYVWVTKDEMLEHFSVAPSLVYGRRGGLRCDDCHKDGHVEAHCYR